MDQVKRKKSANRGNSSRPIVVEMGIARVPIPANRRSAWKAGLAEMYDYLERLILEDQVKAGGLHELNSGS